MSPTDESIVKNQPTEISHEGGPLVAYGGEVPPAPKWFQDAVAEPYETSKVEVNGAQVYYQRWGNKGKPGLLLIHGNGAHAHWWDFIAPYFCEHYHVVAMTFSGMGESEWRDAYDINTFSLEQIAVAEHSGLFEAGVKPIIVAHSFGGFVTMMTGAEYGERFAGTVIVDSPVNPPERPHMAPNRSGRAHHVYPDLTAALGRFRLAPPQECENHFAMDYIARWSLKRVEGGWTWKFDPSIWTRFEAHSEASELLKSTACRIAIIRGEESALMEEDVGEYMRELLGFQVPFISIPHAHHHVMLDQPLAFISALRTLLAEWAHSNPHREI